MKIIPKVGAIGASVALAATAFLAATPAGAETHDIDSALGGSLTVHIPVPDSTDILDAVLPFAEGSTFVGSYDDSTGDLTGTVDIADGSATAEIPGLGAADLKFTFEPSDIQNGTIDEDGNVSYTSTQSLSLTQIVLEGAEDNPQNIDPGCTFELTDVLYTGTYDAETGEIAVATAEPYGITIPEGVACGELTPVILMLLGEATVDGQQQFSIASPEPEPTTTTTTTPGEETTTTVAEEPAPAQPSGPAAPVAAQPTYTG